MPQLPYRSGNVGGDPFDVADVIELGGLFAAFDRRAMSFDGDNFPDALGHRKGKVAGAAIKLLNAVRAVEGSGLDEFFDHRLIALAIDLSEDVGLDV